MRMAEKHVTGCGMRSDGSGEKAHDRNRDSCEATSPRQPKRSIGCSLVPKGATAGSKAWKAMCSLPTGTVLTVTTKHSCQEC